MANIAKGTFVSVWDGGVAISTPCTIDLDTGEVFTEPVEENIDGLDVCEEQYVVLEDGTGYPIIPDEVYDEETGCWSFRYS